MTLSKTRIALIFVAGVICGILLCVLIVFVVTKASQATPPSHPAQRTQKTRGQHDDTLFASSQRPFALKRRQIDGGVSLDEYRETLERMRVVPGASLSMVVHGMHLFGPRFEVPHPILAGQSASALDIILNCQKARVYFGSHAPLVTTRYGVRCRTLISRDTPRQPEREAHSGQLLASLAESGVPLTAVATTADGKYTVSSILADTIATFNLKRPQIEWVATALALYLPPQCSWRNKFGTNYTFDNLVDKLLATSFEDPQLSCQGTHLLYSLAVIRQADQKHQILSKQTRERLSTFLARQVTHLVDTQQLMGQWPDRWYAQESVERLPQSTSMLGKVDRLGVTNAGHHLEWLLLLTDDLAPPDHVCIRAARWLHTQIQIASSEQLLNAYCPYCHGVFSIGQIHTRPVASSASELSALNTTTATKK